MDYTIAQGFRRVLEHVDLLVTPTTPITAPLIGQELDEYGGVQEPAVFALIRCTLPFNIARLPALSLPWRVHPLGAPDRLTNCRATIRGSHRVARGACVRAGNQLASASARRERGIGRTTRTASDGYR